MKKYLKIFGLVISSIFLFTGGAYSASYTIADNTIAFPGYENPLYPQDSIGSPRVNYMEINTYANGDLASVIIRIEANLLIPDALLINNDRSQGDAYDGWDYYVKTNANYPPYNPPGRVSTLYAVDEKNYDYTFATTGRIGHPSGIVINDAVNAIDTWYNFQASDPTPPTLYLGWAFNPDADGLGGEIVYNFKEGLHLNAGWVIGYTEYCANDVILTPEPISLVLLGLGLIGVAGIRRKF